MTHLSRADYEVREIDQATAIELVVRWHYARGGSNTAVYRHGLFRRDSDEPLGVAWWLPPTKVAAQSVTNREDDAWQGVLCLTRLVISPDVPTNGASFLLGQSIRMIRRARNWHTLLTYADTGEGHTGAIYRATNWEYLGLAKGHPRWLNPETGRHVAKKATVTRTTQQMLDLGYERTPPTPKHKFVMRLQ